MPWGRLGFEAGLLGAGESALPGSALPPSCSFRGAPGPSAREQLVPEGAGGCPGEPRTGLLPTLPAWTPALLLRRDRSPCVALRGGGAAGRRAGGHAQSPPSPSRTWGPPCSQMPCHPRLPPSLPGPHLQQVRDPAPSPSLDSTLGGLGSQPPRLDPPARYLEGALRAGVPAHAGLPAGMGSQSRPQSALQGFGYSKDQRHTGEHCGGGGRGAGAASEAASLSREPLVLLNRQVRGPGCGSALHVGPQPWLLQGARDRGGPGCDRGDLEGAWGWSCLLRVPKARSRGLGPSRGLWAVSAVC